jgi:hypothetical protein
MSQDIPHLPPELAFVNRGGGLPPFEPFNIIHVIPLHFAAVQGTLSSKGSSKRSSKGSSKSFPASEQPQ